jgi:Rrf2 family transcriptional regulator, nitric oxide-sensitive transcriptional repressor
MRLTQLTDYAMRVLIHLAVNPDRLCTIAEIAARYQISHAHLTKITHQLSLAGWVRTVRGKGGGMTLALAPHEIELGQVVLTMEPDFDIVECFGTGSSCMLTGSCKLTGVMGGALRSFVEYLDRHTLADILPPPAGERAAKVVRLHRGPRKAAAR